MGHRALFDCRYPSLPRLLAISARHRGGARHLSSTRGASRPDARETGRTESARRREELRIGSPDLALATQSRGAGSPYTIADVVGTAAPASTALVAASAIERIATELAF